MKSFWFLATILVGAGAAMLSMTHNAAGDETPAASRPARVAVVVRIVQRMADAVGQLDLSDEQRKTVQPILDSARQKAQDIAEENQDLSPEERIQNVAPFLRDLRRQLGQVLTPDQMQSLSQHFGPGEGDGTNVTAAQRIQAFKDALAKLDLSADQKKQIADVVTQSADANHMDNPSMSGQDMQENPQQSRQEMRSKIIDILTPDQQQQLRDLLQQGRQQNGGNDAKPATRPSNATSRPQIKTQGPQVGSPAPDFKLTTLDGGTFELSSLKGHVVVLEFGSLSCPVFRDHVQQMEQLHEAMREKAWMMIVYTRENFPQGQLPVKRNKDDGISVAQPTDLAARKALAEMARDKLGVTLPIAVDSMDDQTATDYGGFPNGAVVIGKDGTLLAREQWANPDSLRRIIERTLQD